MKKILFYSLLFPLVIACKKQNAQAISNLPEPDPAVNGGTYTVVTAVTNISSDSGTVYRLGLAPYASFFKFNRSVKNGDLYYKAIGESAKYFRPLKFFITNNGTGVIVAVAAPSKPEVDKFNEEWHKGD
ncbi:hypothetical protein [Chitinophaga polysaccharea]|uniref:hypothetical protein n=1 Tax=Chitinophaga polysaccharea TaxID=1293035 RepID=UPI00115BDD88|nr:hypothetical protein [Chitinophaga polysaccharea]